MNHTQECTICGDPSARFCAGCHSAAYCTIECQQTDWRTHKYLCRSFKDLSPRPSPSHYLAISFPMTNKSWKPRLVWLDTKQIGSGYFEPILDHVLRVPGQQEHISRGIQIVRGNLLRNRPKFVDSLNIRYLDDYDTDKLPVNDTLHGVGGVCADGLGEKFWTGPIVAYLKAGDDFDAKLMTDMTLTAYRDAIDYLAHFMETYGSMIDQPGSNCPLSKNYLAGKKGKVKGVRVNCAGDHGGDPNRQFVQVNVPRSHPLFGLEGDDLLNVSERLGESWVDYRYAGYKDASASEAQNHYGKMLLLDDRGEIDSYRQPHSTGTLLVVDRSKRDLEVSRVKAVCKLVEERVMPLLSTNSFPGVDSVLDSITPEALEGFL